MTPLDSLRHRTGRADSPAGGRADSPAGGRADSPAGGRADSPAGVGVCSPMEVERVAGAENAGKKVYYVYVLQSEKDGNFYVGFSSDLGRRIREHNNGENLSTSYRRPFVLVYYEVCFDGRDAVHREKYLKSSWGKKYIKERIKCYLDGQGGK